MAEYRFTLGQCEILGPSHERSEDIPERGDVVEALVKLDRDVPDSPHTRVLDLNLHRHWQGHFLTCLWYPHQYNGYRVNEIYLRYGKSKQDMDAVDRTMGLPRLEGDWADFGSFPAHVHLSIGLSRVGFFYQLVIGPRAWPDYDGMVRTLEDQGVGDRLLVKLQDLEDAGYRTSFGDDALSRRLGSFSAGRHFAEYLRTDYERSRGKDWFSIRRDHPIEAEFWVETADLIREIRRMYPAFGLIARPVQ